MTSAVEVLGAMVFVVLVGLLAAVLFDFWSNP
jgi:hypothetical protein